MKKIIVLIFICSSFFSCKNEKIAYMDIKVVFNNFKYKQELEKELTEIKNQRKFKLDSLEAQLKLLSNKIKFDSKNNNLMAQFQTEKELYLKQKYIFEEEESAMVTSYDNKIISQLNSYVKEFGKKNNYTMILGATNDGNVMYADTSLNISKEIIEFINNKYNGN
jgi:outer membrane protein